METLPGAADTFNAVFSSNSNYEAEKNEYKKNKTNERKK